MEQSCDLTNRNRIGGVRDRTSWPQAAKSTSTKGHGCRSGRCAAKAVELTPGGLHRVPEGTGGTARGPDRDAGVSRGYVGVWERIEGPNGTERLVGRASRGWKAAENGPMSWPFGRKEKYGDVITLAGNVDCAVTLVTGTPEEAYD